MTRQEGDAYAEVEPGADLAGLEGRKVRLAGRLSEIPWQHIIRLSETHRHIEYLEHGRGQQTVLYLREPPPCRGSVAIFGTLVKTEGGSKRPGTNDPVAEYQLIVDRCECPR